MNMVDKFHSSECQNIMVCRAEDVEKLQAERDKLREFALSWKEGYIKAGCENAKLVECLNRVKRATKMLYPAMEYGGWEKLEQEINKDITDTLASLNAGTSEQETFHLDGVGEIPTSRIDKL